MKDLLERRSKLLLPLLLTTQLKKKDSQLERMFTRRSGLNSSSNSGTLLYLDT